MPIVFVDTETTGLHIGAELVEIAVLDSDGGVLLDTLVRPVHEQEWPEAERVHGIGPADVAAAPTLFELAPTIAGLLQGSDLVVYNAAFECQALPRPIQTQRTTRCAMLAFSAEFGEEDELTGERRYVSLIEASRHVLHSVRRAHRARPDAERCRAVWNYLTDPVERARIDGAHHARHVTTLAKLELLAEETARARHDEQERQRRTDAWMRWLRFPLWLSPGTHGRSLVERGEAGEYHDALSRLFTGLPRRTHELVFEHRNLPGYGNVNDVPRDLAPLSRLRVPRWALEYIKPAAYVVSRSGETFRLLYRRDAMESAYAHHPLRRPFLAPEGHALYSRTQLKRAGYDRRQVERMRPVMEAQFRSKPGTWYSLYCLPSDSVCGTARRPRVAARSGGFSE